MLEDCLFFINITYSWGRVNQSKKLLWLVKDEKKKSPIKNAGAAGLEGIGTAGAEGVTLPVF